MNLFDHTYKVDYLGDPQLVIDDEPLLEWARENNVTPGRAQIEVLRAHIVPLRYLKNLWTLNMEEQLRICSSKVLICGCGGLGGILVHLMARAGVGSMRLVDSDYFTQSNLNRQLLSHSENMFRAKALVAEETAALINPLIEIETFPERLTEENCGTIVEGVDLVLDATDNISARFLLSKTALQLNTPFVHAAVAGCWGQISTFIPGSSLDLKSIYGSREAKDPTEDSIGILGPVASAIGSMEALEAIRILAGRAPAYAGKLLYLDGESGQVEVAPLL
jgi:molybdopterin/thiamine biosynthesis adenylyltransferase